MLKLIRGYEPWFCRVMTADDAPDYEALQWEAYVDNSVTYGDWHTLSEASHREVFEEFKNTDDMESVTFHFWSKNGVPAPRINTLMFAKSPLLTGEEIVFLKEPGGDDFLQASFPNWYVLENEPFEDHLFELQTFGPFDLNGGGQGANTVCWFEGHLFEVPRGLAKDDIELLARAEIIRETNRVEKAQAVSESRLERALVEARRLVDLGVVEEDRRVRGRPCPRRCRGSCGSEMRAAVLAVEATRLLSTTTSFPESGRG